MNPATIYHCRCEVRWPHAPRARYLDALRTLANEWAPEHKPFRTLFDWQWLKALSGLIG